MTDDREIQPMDINFEKDAKGAFKFSASTSDLAVAGVAILLLVVFLLSLVIKSWRSSVGGLLPVLAGVLSAATGAVAIKNLKKK